MSAITQELMYTRVRVMENPECMEWLEDERKRLEEEGVREVPPEAVPIGLNQLCTGMQDSANGGCHGDSGRFPISGIRSSIKAHKRQLGTKRHLIFKSKLINTPSINPSRRAPYSRRGILCAGRGGIRWRKGLREAKGTQHLHEGCSICRLVEGGGNEFCPIDLQSFRW